MDRTPPKHNKTRIDENDLKIVSALERLGGKASAEELSTEVGIPSRTVRYRIARMVRNGHLQPMMVMTHERLLGLGDSFLILEQANSGHRFPTEIFGMIPWMYFYTPTYGKYNGFLAHAAYSLQAPSTNPDLLDAMRRGGLISDYYIFNIADYETKPGDFNRFDPDHGWVCDWDEWSARIEKTIKGKKRPAIRLEENPAPIAFDAKDVLILRSLLKNAKITLRELGQMLGLSEPQVKKRIRRMEKSGIIKRYRPSFSAQTESATIYCIFEPREPVESIISCFYQLPHPLYMIMESRHKFCINISLSAKDINGFLQGLDMLRGHFDSCFIQTMHQRHPLPFERYFDLFNEKTGKWETPVGEYLPKIQHYFTAGAKA